MITATPTADDSPSTCPPQPTGLAGSEIIINPWHIRDGMGSYITTISVPEGSVAQAKIRQWKKEGGNISANICMMIEDQGDVHDVVRHLERELARTAQDLAKANQRIDYLVAVCHAAEVAV